MSIVLKLGGALERRNYYISIVFNDIYIKELVIDTHYEKKHPEMSDSIIIALVSTLNGLKLAPTKTDLLFSYFVEEPVYFMSKPYRLVIVLEQGKKYIGVINAFRVKEK
jgi:hypothetical protein